MKCEYVNRHWYCIRYFHHFVWLKWLKYVGIVIHRNVLFSMKQHGTALCTPLLLGLWAAICGQGSCTGISLFERLTFCVLYVPIRTPSPKPIFGSGMFLNIWHHPLNIHQIPPNIPQGLIKPCIRLGDRRMRKYGNVMYIMFKDVPYNWALFGIVWVGNMRVSLNGGTPISHPKMIFFSRKTHGCWGNPPF